MAVKHFHVDVFHEVAELCDYDSVLFSTSILGVVNDELVRRGEDCRG